MLFKQFKFIFTVVYVVVQLNVKKWDPGKQKDVRWQIWVLAMLRLGREFKKSLSSGGKILYTLV